MDNANLGPTEYNVKDIDDKGKEINHNESQRVRK